MPIGIVDGIPKLLGAAAALIAIFAGVIAEVDSVLCLERAGLAFLLGWLAGKVWYVLFSAGVKPGQMRVLSAEPSPAPEIRNGQDAG